MTAVIDNDRDGINDSDPLSVDRVGDDAAGVGTTVAGSAGDSFVLNADGSYRFDPGTAFDYPAAGETATTSVTYRVTDGQGGTATAPLTVTVNGANDAPTTTTPLADATNNDSERISLATAGSFTDRDTSDKLTYTATGLP